MRDTMKMEVAGIDYAQGLRRFAGQAELYEEFIAEFFTDGGYERLCEEMARGDYRAAFQSAHTLKGTSGNMSFDLLYEKVSALTEALRRHQTEGIGDLWEAVQRVYAQTKEALL